MKQGWERLDITETIDEPPSWLQVIQYSLMCCSLQWPGSCSAAFEALQLARIRIIHYSSLQQPSDSDQEPMCAVSGTQDNMLQCYIATWLSLTPWAHVAIQEWIK